MTDSTQTVSEAAREAAAEIIQINGHAGWLDRRKAILDGHNDGHPYVQFLARFERDILAGAGEAIAFIRNLDCECDSYHGVTCGRCKFLARQPVDRDILASLDDRPDLQGSPACKIMSYNHAHEDAVEMGYPSLTEALEHLAELRSATPPPPAVERVAKALAAVEAAMDAAVRPDGGDWQFDFERAPLWVGDGLGDDHSYLERIVAWEVGPGEAAQICESLNALTSMALLAQVRAAIAAMTPKQEAVVEDRDHLADILRAIDTDESLALADHIHGPAERLQQALAVIAAQRANIGAALATRLRPFASAGEYLMSETTGFRDDAKLWIMTVDECGKCHGLFDSLTFGDFRRAALSPTEADNAG